MIRVPVHVLIVDDEEDFTTMLALRLEEAGFRVRTACDGRRGLEALAEAESDVVILDIRMPGMDGITTLKEIRSRHPVVEVILLTGHGTIETAVEGLKSGAFDYLLKPATFEELLTKLEAAGKRKAEQEDRIRRAEARILTRRSGDI